MQGLLEGDSSREQVRSCQCRNAWAANGGFACAVLESRECVVLLFEIVSQFFKIRVRTPLPRCEVGLKVSLGCQMHMASTSPTMNRIGNQSELRLVFYVLTSFVLSKNKCNKGHENRCDRIMFHHLRFVLPCRAVSKRFTASLIFALFLETVLSFLGLLLVLGTTTTTKNTMTAASGFSMKRTTTSTTTTTTTAQWIPLTPDQLIEPRRSGHTAFVHGKSPFVFGGYAEVDTPLSEDSSSSSSSTRQGQPETTQTQRFVVNDLWRWKKDNDDAKSSPKWVRIPTQGDTPGPRLVSASAVVVDKNNNKKAFLFGGWDPETAGTGGSILDTVHELDLDSNSNDNPYTWTLLPVRTPDGPTSRHVAVAIPLQQQQQHPDTTTILIHTHRCIDYVWLFDSVQQTFVQQVTTGPCPSSRGLHAAVLLGDNRTVCVFGGAAQNQAMSNETFLLDLESWQWTRLHFGNDYGPTPRAGSCLVAIPQKEGFQQGCAAVLFGGAEATPNGLNPRADVWLLSLPPPQPGSVSNNAATWSLLLSDKDDDDDTNATNRPKPRNAATLTPIELNDNDINNNNNGTSHCFLLTGGWAPFRQTWGDCFVLQVNCQDIP